MYDPYKLVSLLLATDKIQLIISPGVRSPYCDPVLKIIYLPEKGYGLGSVLHEMAHLKYSQRLDNIGKQIAKSLSVLPPEIVQVARYALDDLVQALEDVRVETKLLDKYPGAIDPVADEYLPSTDKKPVPLPVKILADMLRSRYYAIDQLDIPIVDRINDELLTLTQSTTQKMVKDLLTGGMVEAWLTWVLETPEALEYYTQKSQNKTQQKQMRAKLNKLMKLLKGMAMKFGGRKSATKEQLARKARAIGGKAVRSLAKSILGEVPGWGNSGIKYEDRESEQETRQKLNSEIAPYLATLTATLKKIKAHGYTRTLVNQRKGKLDNTRLSRVVAGKTDRVFKKREKTKKNAQTAISVIIDKSGSMGYGYASSIDDTGSRMQQARLSAYLLAVAMQKAKRPLHIVSFNHFIKTIKTWEDSHKWPVAISKIAYGGDNRDGDAIEASIKALDQRAEIDKLIIMLTDGQVCQDRELKEQLARAKHKGIRVVAIAIGQGTLEEAKNYYSKAYAAPEAKDIPLAMAKLLKDEKLL